MQQLLQFLTFAYGAFMVVVPIIIINLLIAIRRDMSESQRATAQAQGELNRTLATLADSLKGYQRDTWADQPAAAPTWNVLSSPGGTTPAALTTLLADPEIAKAARDVKRIYGDDVCVSFLTRKAAERGLPVPPLTASDLPAVL